jgi:ribonuclease P protein component
LDFSFTKSDKIRKSRDYSLLKETGSVFKTKLMVFNYSVSERTKLGVIVTKKVGNSVFRNRVKRWIREVFRTERGRFVTPVDLVMIPRQSSLSYEDIKRDFLYFAVKLNGKSSNRIN